MVESLTSVISSGRVGGICKVASIWCLEIGERRVNDRGVGGGISGGRRKFRWGTRRMCDRDEMSAVKLVKWFGTWKLAVVRRQVRLTSPVGIGLDG
jgi:hypothetical protein